MHEVLNIKTVPVKDWDARKIVVCDRSSEWGNPFRIGPDGDREEVIAKFRRYFLHSPLYFRIGELYGKDFACHCAPKSCHCDIYKSFLDRAITSFRSRHIFLSNFFMCSVVIDGRTYKSAEHAYQASKAQSEGIRHAIIEAVTPKEAKLIGSRVPLPKGWDRIKVVEMDKVIRAKFSNDYLARALKKTGDAPLIEVNTWDDKFWGWCGGEGKNMLGALLMKARRYMS